MNALKEDGLEEGKPAGWEKDSGRVLERHTRKPDPGRWMDDGLLLCVKVQGGQVKWYTSWEWELRMLDGSFGPIDREDPMEI